MEENIKKVIDKYCPTDKNLIYKWRVIAMLYYLRYHINKENTFNSSKICNIIDNYIKFVDEVNDDR